jgi:putative RecB family exonuclease
MPVYSHTRLSTFEQCPRRYYYQYIAKLAVEEEQGIEGFLGSLVHDALEKLYRDRMFGRGLTPYQLIKHFRAQWDRRFHDGIVIVRTDYGPDDYKRAGEQCLWRYHTRYAPFNQDTTIALEERIGFPLDKDGQYRITGVIDRLSQRPDGTYEIHDYKTSRRLPSQADQDQDRQLGLYQLGIQDRWNDTKRVELVWHFLQFDKDLRSTRTQIQLRQLRADTIRLVDEIEGREAEDDFEPNESPLCNWCPFPQTCPVRKHVTRTEALPVNRFLKEPGVKLVNRHSQIAGKIECLKEQIAELEAEQEEVDEALLAYAKREKVKVIVGSTHEARIAEREQIILPRKTQEPERFDKLDRLLRRNKCWPKISAMDMPTLRRIWKGELDDPGQIRKLLKPFVTEEKVTTVRFRARSTEE